MDYQQQQQQQQQATKFFHKQRLRVFTAMIFARYSSHLSELAYTDVGSALFAVFLLCKFTINRENEKIKEKMPAGVRQMAAAWLVLNRKKEKQQCRQRKRKHRLSRTLRCEQTHDLPGHTHTQLSCAVAVVTPLMRIAARSK